MDYVTIFGDIHGNLPALQAVFADMDARNLENRYCLGDLVGYGTSPNEVINIVRQHNIPTLMGNYDQGVGHSSDDCGCAYTTEKAKQLGNQSIAWTNNHVTDENKAYLRALPSQIPVNLGEFNVLLVHGSPRKINEYLYENRSDASLQRIMDGIEASVLVCGHTHLPYHKVLSDGQQIINAGSVGKPKDNNPDACYVVLSADGDALSAEFIRVPYDVEKAAQAIEATTMPDEFAAMLRAGQG
jgi:predicted phosphodiesterase